MGFVPLTPEPYGVCRALALCGAGQGLPGAPESSLLLRIIISVSISA